MEDLKQVILAYVIKEYLEEGDDRVIDEKTPLITSGIVDSFSMVSLKVFLERKYAIRIPDEDATPAAFDSVARIAELVTHIREAAPRVAVS
jgi:acyl carrier protein